MSFKKITIAGGGVQGSQIAVQTAFKGFEVTIWVRSEESLQRTVRKIEALKASYLDTLENMKTNPESYCKGFCSVEESKSIEKIDELKSIVVNHLKLTVTTDKQAFADADLIIEAVPEDEAVKHEFYQMIAPLIREDAVVTTDSSTMIPSKFKDDLPHPERYLMLHFANPVVRFNMAEIMRHPDTDEAIFNAVYAFAEEIGMSPTRIYKEIPRGVLNFMLVPFLQHGAYLWGSDIASPEDIDKTWKAGTGHIVGPFQLLDIVGLNTVYAILMMMPEAKQEGSVFAVIAERIKKMIDNGEKFYPENKF